MSLLLVDTSVWIDHFRTTDPALSAALMQERVLCHPWVIGEIALGHIKARDAVLKVLQGMPMAEVANDSEVLVLLESEALAGSGLGYVDVGLLAATRLTPHTQLWTRDKRLHAVAARMGIAAHVDH